MCSESVVFSLPFLTPTRCCALTPSSPHRHPHWVSQKRGRSYVLGRLCKIPARGGHGRKRLIETQSGGLGGRLWRGLLQSILLFSNTNKRDSACRILRSDIIKGDVLILMTLAGANICWAVTGAKYCFKYFHKLVHFVLTTALRGIPLWSPFYLQTRKLILVGPCSVRHYTYTASRCVAVTSRHASCSAALLSITHALPILRNRRWFGHIHSWGWCWWDSCGKKDTFF